MLLYISSKHTPNQLTLIFVWLIVLIRNVLTMQELHGVVFNSVGLGRDKTCANLFSYSQCSYLQTIIDALISNIEEKFEQQKAVFKKEKSIFTDHILQFQDDYRVYEKKQNTKETKRNANLDNNEYIRNSQNPKLSTNVNATFSSYKTNRIPKLHEIFVQDEVMKNLTSVRTIRNKRLFYLPL